MRKGELKIEKVKKPKVNRIYFNSDTKSCIFIKAFREDGSYYGVNAAYPANPVSIYNDTDEFFEVTVVDSVTREEFDMNVRQIPYVYKSGQGNDFKFYTMIDPLSGEELAWVLAKNVEMTCDVRNMANIADSYGNYVSGQKSIKEPAKNFEDWFFDVSI